MLIKLTSAACLAISAFLVTGCGGFGKQFTNVPVSAEMGSIKGRTFGGQQPVAGATIQLYQVGTTGYGVGATPLLTSTVATDSSGNFTITGKYTCTAGTQVYITATGGDPGAGTNTALALMAGLGLCDNLTSSTFIIINEVTTVATVYALAPFMNGSDVGSPLSNAAGLAAAFGDINLLTNTATGTSPGAGLPATTTVPVAEINTLADILASCVNSTGTGGGGACDTLFSSARSTAGTIPSDTISAMLNIARHPGRNVSNLLELAAPDSPFHPVVSSATDFTVGIIFSGSGLSSPSSLAVDANNNVWITNSGSNSVTELSHAGTVLSGTGFTAGSFNAPSGIAVASNGNVWVANAGNSTLTELTSTGTNVSGSPFSGGGLDVPSSVAIDALGYVWLANSGNSTLSAFAPSGAPSSPASGFTGGPTAPVAVAVDPH